MYRQYYGNFTHITALNNTQFLSDVLQTTEKMNKKVRQTAAGVLSTNLDIYINITCTLKYFTN